MVCHVRINRDGEDWSRPVIPSEFAPPAPIAPVEDNSLPSGWEGTLDQIMVVGKIALGIVLVLACVAVLGGAYWLGYRIDGSLVQALFRR